MVKVDNTGGKLTITIDMSEISVSNKLYSRDEACEYLGIVRQTFSKRRKLAEVPYAGPKGKYTQEQINLIAKAR